MLFGVFADFFKMANTFSIPVRATIPHQFEQFRQVVTTVLCRNHGLFFAVEAKVRANRLGLVKARCTAPPKLSF